MSMPKRGRVECCDIPLKPKPGLTPISCHAVLERSACAPFIKERRIECVNATSLSRQSGQAFVAGARKAMQLFRSLFSPHLPNSEFFGSLFVQVKRIEGIYFVAG